MYVGAKSIARRGCRPQPSQPRIEHFGVEQRDRLRIMIVPKPTKPHLQSPAILPGLARAAFERDQLRNNIRKGDGFFLPLQDPKIKRHRILNCLSITSEGIGTKRRQTLVLALNTALLRKSRRLSLGDVRRPLA